MAPVLDGLLDAELDLHVVWLAVRYAASTWAHTPPEAHAHLYVSNPLTSSPPPPHLADAQLHLHVPHLHIPWMPTLARLVHRHLHLRLLPPPTTPSPPLAPLQAALAASDRQDPSWRSAAATLYPSAAPPLAAHNARVLAHLRRAHAPRILERIALAARLTFLNAILTATSPPSPSPTPLPPRPRRRPAAIVRAVRLSPTRALLHGQPIPTALLPALSRVLRTSHNLLVEPPPPRHHPSTGSLASVCATRAPPSPPRPRSPVMLSLPTTSSSMSSPKNTSSNNPSSPSSIPRAPVDMFLTRQGTTWRTVLSTALPRARALHAGEHAAAVARRSEVLREAAMLRATLIERALTLEVAGESLARICAFALVRNAERDEVVDRLVGFGGDVADRLHEARGRLAALEQVETRCADRLVAGMCVPPTAVRAAEPF